ncbi:exopolysaccharide biosynthesis protein [Ramlibacter sp. AW1]|uniref:Exopolysaccharide biosynthesis protein n=1 Tax=Ramlibacter aurantiacus TaxID=2801330 RepID=A0A937D5V3_9BURK|nr:exopolysaccharide biosynthesis protein [Ramlibacter aurantiacus]MBL0423095.1 exopolysaccharide biosynthesis protein [Ramlibacter aurantiacus]
MSKRLAATMRRAAREHASPQAAGLQLTLPGLLHLHGSDSAAVLLLLLALFSGMPIAGAGTVLAFIILALAWRWHRGPDVAPRLPERLERLALSDAWSRRCLHALCWLYGTSARVLRARWTLLCHPRTHWGWGLWIGLMGVLILLPLPFGNVLPSLSLILLSLGWMFRDGIALLSSAVVGTGAVGFAGATVHVLVDWVGTGLAWLQRLA